MVVNHGVSMENNYETIETDVRREFAVTGGRGLNRLNRFSGLGFLWWICI